MERIPVTLALLSGFLLKAPVTAQLDITTGLPPAQIIELLEGTGVTISNLEIFCPPSAMGSFIGTSALPIEEGLVLTTGFAQLIPQPADVFASGILGTGSDIDLTALAGTFIMDRCVLSFDCIPVGDTLMFNYVFASEEYPSFVCLPYNDVFGLFLSGPGINGPFTNNAVNLAWIPGTSMPVSIQTVHGGYANDPAHATCPAVNPDYYINNTGGTDVVYNGFTEYLQATAVVQAGATYNLKLAVGDAYDSSYDSAVFFEAFSFRSTGITTGLDQLHAMQPGLLHGPEMITVQLPHGHGARELRLLSATGALVSRHPITSDQVELPTAGLPAGLYIIQPVGSGALAAVRFVHE